MNIIQNVVQTIEATPPNVAHTVGASSVVVGGSGAALAYYAEVAKHLTVFVGLAAGFAALLGASFYAVYWALKAFAAFRAVRRGEEVK